MRVRALLAACVAGVLAFGFALALRSNVLALIGTVLCSASFLALLFLAILAEARRFKPKVQYDHSFLSWLLGDTSTPHPVRGAPESDPSDDADATTSPKPRDDRRQ